MMQGWRFTPQQIMQAAHGQEVPGLTDGPMGKAIWHAQMGNVARLDFDQARKRGYLWLRRQREDAHHPEHAAVWCGWWCHACRIPEAVVRSDAASGVSLRFDLSPTGTLFLPTAVVPIGQAIRDAAPGFGWRWIVSPDTVEVDELAAESAHGLAHALLLLAKERRVVQSERTLPPV